MTAVFSRRKQGLFGNKKLADKHKDKRYDSEIDVTINAMVKIDREAFNAKHSEFWTDLNDPFEKEAGEIIKHLGTNYQVLEKRIYDFNNKVSKIRKDITKWKTAIRTNGDITKRVGHHAARAQVVKQLEMYVELRRKLIESIDKIL